MQIEKALEEGTVSVVVEASGPRPDRHAAGELATYGEWTSSLTHRMPLLYTTVVTGSWSG